MRFHFFRIFSSHVFKRDQFSSVKRSSSSFTLHTLARSRCAISSLIADIEVQKVIFQLDFSEGQRLNVSVQNSTFAPTVEGLKHRLYLADLNE